MLRFRLSCAALFLSFLAGCAVPPQGDGTAATETTASTESESEVMNELAAVRADELSERFEAVARRMRAICVSPENKAYFRKTGCLPNDITDEMTRDKTSITAEQKRAAENVFKRTHELNEQTRDLMFRTGIPEYMDQAIYSRTHTDPLIRNLQSRLLSREITWGEYNAERRALAEESTAERDD